MSSALLRTIVICCCLHVHGSTSWSEVPETDAYDYGERTAQYDGDPYWQTAQDRNWGLPKPRSFQGKLRRVYRKTTRHPQKNINENRDYDPWYPGSAEGLPPRSKDDYYDENFDYFGSSDSDTAIRFSSESMSKSYERPPRPPKRPAPTRPPKTVSPTRRPQVKKPAPVVPPRTAKPTSRPQLKKPPATTAPKTARPSTRPGTERPARPHQPKAPGREQTCSTATYSEALHHYSLNFPPDPTSLDFDRSDVITKLKAKHTHSIPTNEVLTICWIETVTTKEDTSVTSAKRLVLREYSISFENAAQIPDAYLNCSTVDEEITATVDESASPSGEEIDRNSRSSRVVELKKVTTEDNLRITREKTVKCATGPAVTKDVYQWMHIPDYPLRLVEITVGPHLKNTTEYPNVTATGQPTTASLAETTTPLLEETTSTESTSPSESSTESVSESCSDESCSAGTSTEGSSAGSTESDCTSEGESCSKSTSSEEPNTETEEITEEIIEAPTTPPEMLEESRTTLVVIETTVAATEETEEETTPIPTDLPITTGTPEPQTSPRSEDLCAHPQCGRELSKTVTQPTPTEAEPHPPLNASTSVETRRTTGVTPPIPPEPKLKLRLKVVVERVYDSNETEPLVQVERQLALKGESGERIVEEIRALNDSINNVESFRDLLSCSTFANLSSLLPSSESSSSSYESSGEDDSNSADVHRKGRSVEPMQSSEKVTKQAEVIEKCLSGIRNDVKVGLTEIVSQIANSLDGSVHPTAPLPMEAFDAVEKDERTPRAKRNVDVEGDEPISQWSNERFREEPDGGRIRSFTEMMILRVV